MRIQLHGDALPARFQQVFMCITIDFLQTMWLDGFIHQCLSLNLNFHNWFKGSLILAFPQLRPPWINLL